VVNGGKNRFFIEKILKNTKIVLPRRASEKPEAGAHVLV
jgi:hypothetical protein